MVNARYMAKTACHRQSYVFMIHFCLCGLRKMFNFATLHYANCQ